VRQPGGALRLLSVEAIVFDLGGVLVEVDFRRVLARWAAACGERAEALAARFQRDDAYCAHERGTLDDAAYFAHLRAALGVQMSDAELLAGWNTALGDPLPGVEPLVARLAAEYPLYVFSNTNPAHLAHFTPRYRRLLSRFRHVYTSCELGERKPEPQAFARLAAAIGIPAGKLLFFDDLEENVAGARRAGLHAFRVTRLEEVAAVLRQKRSAR
jgi:putative hydrolase of the HAD superfamily